MAEPSSARCGVRAYDSGIRGLPVGMRRWGRMVRGGAIARSTAVTLACVVTACSSSVTRLTPTQVERPAQTSQKPAAPPVGEARPKQVISFELGSEVSVRAARLLRQRVPRHIDSSQLETIELQLLEEVASPKGSAQAPLAQAAAWAIVDEQAPRPLGSGGRSLAATTSELVEFGPGKHHVSVVRRSQDGYQVELSSFSYDVQAEPSAPPACLLLLPAGTYNGGDAAAQVDFVGLTLSPKVAELSFVVQSHSARGERSVGPQRSVQASLVSGDYQVRLDCLDASGKTLSSFERTITVNREVRFDGE